MKTTTKIHDHNVTIEGGLFRAARLEQEWYEDLNDPEEMARVLSQERSADILTFWQRLPDLEPKYRYYHEVENIAVLPITTYDHWWNQQIKSRTRGLIRKSEKQGVVVKEEQYNDDFVRGITRIFNESPMRQGRPFWHYGKDFDTVKREFSKYLFRELLLGAAYVGDELVGFMMIGRAGRYAVTGQIISMISHRDKGPTNCLVAKAVEVCAREQLPYLVYLHWGVGSLSEFKRRTGFQKTPVPRDYVPLSAKGRLALRLGIHKGLVRSLPEPTLARLKHARALWYRSFYSFRHSASLVRDGD